MKIQKLNGFLAILVSLLLTGCSDEPDASGELAEFELGSTRNVHRMGDIILSGQPSLDDWDAVSRKGVNSVISLRHFSEISEYDEQALVTGKGMQHVQIPFGSAQELTDEVFEKVRSELKSAQKPLLLHCASANRVGAVWLPYRVLDGGLEFEKALAEAKQIGLRSAAYQQRAEAYISEKSSGSD